MTEQVEVGIFCYVFKMWYREKELTFRMQAGLPINSRECFCT